MFGPAAGSDKPRQRPSSKKCPGLSHWYDAIALWHFSGVMTARASGRWPQRGHGAAVHNRRLAALPLLALLPRHVPLSDRPVLEVFLTSSAHLRGAVANFEFGASAITCPARPLTPLIAHSCSRTRSHTHEDHPPRRLRPHPRRRSLGSVLQGNRLPVPSGGERQGRLRLLPKLSPQSAKAVGKALVRAIGRGPSLFSSSMPPPTLRQRPPPRDCRDPTWPPDGSDVRNE
jgi:hypothetical protein